MTSASTNTRTFHSERAKWAWEKVSGVAALKGAIGLQYATHVRKLPARLQINGLGQALAFLFAKSKPGKDKIETGAARLLVHLGERLAMTLEPKPHDLRDSRAIMEAIVKMSPDQYRRSTHELMTTAEWLKRFADGLFEKEDNGTHD